MNRRSILTLLVGVMIIPCELVSAMAKGSPEPSCEDCKKCGPTCKCNCKKKCRCKPGCCKKDHTDSGSSGRPPRSRPPQGRPSSDRNSRYREMIKKFDKNKDGKLDEKEREALKKYIQKRRG